MCIKYINLQTEIPFKDLTIYLLIKTFKVKYF